MQWIPKAMTLSVLAALVLGAGSLVGCDVDDEHHVEIQRPGEPNTEVRWDDDIDDPPVNIEQRPQSQPVQIEEDADRTIKVEERDADRTYKIEERDADRTYKVEEVEDDDADRTITIEED